MSNSKMTVVDHNKYTAKSMCDEKLKDLLHLRTLQNQVITLRNDAPPIYGEMLKEEAKIIIRNLVNSEVILETKPVQKPKQVDLNLDEYKTEPQVALADIDQRIDNLLKCLKYYKT